MKSLKRYDFVRIVRTNDPVNLSDSMILECSDGPFIRVEDLLPIVSALFYSRDDYDFEPKKQAALIALFELFGLKPEESL